jgi:predicted amidohydrolase YtcJ
MKGINRFLAATAGLALAMAAGAAPRPAGEAVADLILTGGKVITVDPVGTIAEAVAVRDERIVAVGSVADIATWQGQGTQVLSLKGRTILPGFIDSHSHISGMANVEANYINIQVPPLKDAAAIITRLKAAQAGKPKGAWLIGQGTYNQVMPTRAQLDAAFPDTPVDLQWSVHDHLINHSAAIAMGMTKTFPDPPKGATGRYERTADGEVMITRDAPVPLPAKPMSFAALKEGVRGVLDTFYLRKGITTVSDLSEPETFRAEQQLREEGRLPVRILANYWVKAFGDGESAIVQTGLSTGLGDDWLRLAAIKVPVDGVWGTTAAVYKPFWQGSGTTWVPDNVGGTGFDQPALDRVVLEAHRAGWQIEAHANGDRAQDMILTAYEHAQQAAPRADARDRIEHFGNFMVQDPDRTQERLARMVRDHVIPSPQPAFLWRLTDTNIQEPGVKFFALRDMIALGLHPAGGIDTIGTQNYATYPMFSIARAAGRRTKYGKIVQPEEAISVMEGIRMFTIWAAEAGFIEGNRGSIEVGKLADFAVLDRDPLTTPVEALPDIPVAMTIIGGRIAYRRQ